MFQWVPIELGVHGVLTVLQLLTSHWYLFLLNLPLCAWEAYRQVLLLGIWGQMH